MIIDEIKKPRKKVVRMLDFDLKLFVRPIGLFVCESRLHIIVKVVCVIFFVRKRLLHLNL